MAVLQIHVIRATGGRNQLNDRIKYIMNPEKTTCKGFHSFFGIKDTLTSGFTCACDEAYQQMMETKQHEKKTDKVLGYHYIQSFKPGEVTPEEAHQVGCEFIERCFAEDFEVVIGTHTDHAHIHNHIILNSVSFVDGHKFQSTPASFYKLREISDEICRAHHLSVIDEPKTRKAKHYAEWKAEQEYRPTIRNEIRRDIDVVLKQSHSLNNFWELLRLRGYEIKFNEKRKYAAIRPPNGKRFIRMKSLGEEYTPRELVKRLEAADKSEVAANRRSFQQIYQQRKHRKKYYALPWTIIPHRRLTLRGIRALYWRYVYMLSKVRARKAPRAVRGVMLDELKKLERYSQQYYFLRDNRLNTKADVNLYAEALSNEIYVLTDRRKHLYAECRKPDADKQTLKAQTKGLTEELRVLRKKQRTCKTVLENAPAMEERLETANTEWQRIERNEDEHSKEVKPNVGRSRSGGTSAAHGDHADRIRSQTRGNRSSKPRNAADRGCEK